MSLAYLARLYPNELICDMAETYHVYDWRALPGRLAATLAAGLREDSRVKMAAAGQKVRTETLLGAICADALRVQIWQNSRDGMKGKNPPSSIVEKLLEMPTSNDSGEGFAESAEFMAWRNSMLGGGDNGV